MCRIVIICLVSFFHFAAAQDADSEFHLVKKDGNIKVFERWITFPRSNPPIRAREVKGEFVIATTIADAIALLKNEEKIKQWQDHVSEFKIFDTDDSSTWLEYSYHDIPWPVSDQDHLVQYYIEPNGSTDKISIRFENKVDDSLAPVKEDATRIEIYGSWTFQKLSDGNILASYTIMSKPNGIPRIFTDPVIRSNLMRTIKGFIGILEEGK
jgi:hypothetical protein